MPIADEVDYEIQGTDTQFIEIELDPNESAVAEAGSMLCMDDGIEMNTIFGDGSNEEKKSGILGTLIGAGKRLVTGEGLFMTVFTNQGHGKKRVAFAAPYPGKIIPMDLSQQGGLLICQKDAFLCAAKGVSLGIAFQKNIMSGIFGGEGFILQKLEGDGLTFIHAGGTIFEKKLEAGQSLRVDTGCVVAFQPSVSFDIKTVPGVKSALFGGEGIFLAHLTGPGNVWLQSMPFSHLAAQIVGKSGHSTGSTGNNPLENIVNILESR
ncbi:MAG: TIGR00266 family protein [Pseudomonadota bacterium]